MLAAERRAAISPARASCRMAIDKRFGWLKDEVVRRNGSIEGLPPHMRLLWFAREKVIARYHKIMLYEPAEKRDRAYARLEKELHRR